MSDPQLRLDGQTWLSSLGFWGDLTWSKRLAGGCWDLSWSMAGQPPNFAPRALRSGASVELFEGPARRWYGTLTSPDYKAQTFTAQGTCRDAEHTISLDSAGVPTGAAKDAVLAAIARGALGWTYSSGGLNGMIYPGEDKNVYLNTLLDSVSADAAKYWGVDEDNTFYLRAPDADPTWDLVPDLVQIGVGDDDYFTHAYGRYATTTDTSGNLGGWQTATAASAPAVARWKRREVFVDLTPLGATNTTAATNVVAGRLARTGARMGYTNGFEVLSWQLLRNGVPANLTAVKPGQGVRLNGLLSDAGRLDFGLTTTITLDELTWAGPDRLTIKPLGLVARDVRSIIAGDTSDAVLMTK